MLYPKHFEQKIGFDKIRELLIERCYSNLGRVRVSEMSFLTDYETVLLLLRQTNEMKQICQFEEQFPKDNYIDLTTCINRLRIDGTFIRLEELADLRSSLATIYTICNFFKQRAEQYPNLAQIVADIVIHKGVIDKIDTILDRHGRMKDNASPELLRVRREITAKRSVVGQIMQRIMKQARAEGWVDDDAELSFRDGRAVLAVQSTHKRKIKGYVLDESATGKTSFIEPAEAFEVNNEINRLEFDEQREMIRILTDFTDFLRPSLPDIEQSYHCLAHIDFTQAKARLAIDLDAWLPRVESYCVAELELARHPLLYLSHRREGKDVVPLRIILNRDQRILLISGPNAGGKSVCLKTTGLLQYMLQSGLLVTVAEHSTMGIFNHIFIDIGDEQSIENDLSTYSSHLLNMRNFVDFSDKRTLILIDEFGAGTEPILGGAIAEAVLEQLNIQGVYGVITTHYANLKHFAARAEGIVNGAMLYDNEHLRPLYKLRIGTPGSSFAFEIAKTIGLSTSILEKAASKIDKAHVDYDKNLKDLEQEKQYLFKKRKEIDEREQRLQNTLTEYQTKLQDVQKQRKDIIETARKEAKEMLSGTNRMIENTIRQIKESQADKERTRELRTELEDFKSSVDVTQKNDQIDSFEREMERIKQRQERKKQPRQAKQTTVNLGQNMSNVPDEPLDTPICVGDKVRIDSQTTPGEVLELSGNDAVVAFGSIKTKVKIERLRKMSNREYREQNRPSTRTANSHDFANKRLFFKPSIDVRGKRGEEVLREVEDLIEQAIVFNVNQLQILHGKGDGILRSLIRDYLKRTPQVKAFSDAHIEMGGAGITIVEMK